jgi:hypothetical protein
MAIEDIFTMLENGTYPPAELTPLSDQAFALLKTDLPFREKWMQIQILSKQVRRAGGEDADRFKWVIESIYAGATAEEISLMHEDIV